MSYRWYVSVTKWQPTKDQLLKISSLIQTEEKIRIARFHFMNDAKSSLVGRLLIRKLLNVETKCDNHLIELIRDDRNKPTLSKPCASVNFNVSHQGNYVVIAADSAVQQLGVDVMNIEKPGSRISKNVVEYFSLMRSTFTDNEWSQIKGPSLNSPIANFTRFWCLKESYVKAIGLGIVIDLKSVDFQTHSDLLLNQVLTDTQVKVNGQLESRWTFEERFLDSSYIVAVAKEGNSIALNFEEKSLEFLLENMTPLTSVDEEWADGFMSKQIRVGD